jgi:hypothetical protein
MKNEDLSLPQLIKRPTSQSARMIDENEEDSLDSDEDNGDGYHPISLKKEIYTIQQLMDLARPKSAMDYCRSPADSNRQASECK